MAIVNKYVSANYAVQKLDSVGQYGPGAVISKAFAYFQPVSTDSVGSVYRLFKGIPSDAIVNSLTIFNDAWTNCTSVNLGLYGVLDFDGVGAIVGTGNQLASAYSPAAGTPASGAAVNLLTAVSIANRNQPLWVIAGQAEYPPKFSAFDVCLTTVTNSGSATPNILVMLDYIRGV